MRDGNQFRIERNIAQCRMILSVATPLMVYLDPTEPILVRLVNISGAAFFIDPLALAILLIHLAYSVSIYLWLTRTRVPLVKVATVSMWGDVLFGAAVALVTEGTNSPFYVYFLFAVLAVGLRGGFRVALVVTAASVGLYLCLIFLARPEGPGFYLVRAVYIAITGYLVGFLGRQRRVLESNLQGLARSLHDGYAQALAGVNLRVETCLELIRRGQGQEAFAELTELQSGVTREYDDLRALVRSLAGLTSGPDAGRLSVDETRFAVRANFDAPLSLVEHALQIMLEGARNVSRHASAQSAVISVNTDADRVLIRIDDDGVGFPQGANPPWSIASRAAELGGDVRIVSESLDGGGHVVVELPED